MINENSAIYIGIVTAVVLERCPTATVHTERSAGGYEMTCMRKAGVGKDAISVFDKHNFSDAETRAVSAAALAAAARTAGETIGASLVNAKQ